MKKVLAILLVLAMFLSLFACGKTESPETNDDAPNEQKRPGNEEEKDPVPTDPVSKEVYDLKHNEDLISASLTLGNYKNFTGWTEDEVNGSVRIWGNTLQFWFVIPKSTIDATVGFDAEDMSDYHFSFKVYLREQNVEGAEYKSVHTNLIPNSLYLDPTLTIYRCPFYNSGLLDIVEVGKTYDTVIAIYENDKVVGWGEHELTWHEDSQNLVEQAEQDESIIK